MAHGNFGRSSSLPWLQAHFNSTFGTEFPQCAARGSRSYSVTHLPPLAGSQLIGPQFDASFKPHTYCASLGPDRGVFRNTQKYWQPEKEQVPRGRPRRVILGGRLQQRAAEKPLAQEAPVFCYTGIVQWGPNNPGIAHAGHPGKHSFSAHLGGSPTGRGGRAPLGMDSVTLPRLPPGF
mmetsp:Transcript_153641/g.492465  ORF Transcript_153641/g.492465 Transcript_153641/m.492465 type:complete len:178 (+) Transcript_153641:321-854(+)